MEIHLGFIYDRPMEKYSGQMNVQINGVMENEVFNSLRCHLTEVKKKDTRLRFDNKLD